MVKLIGCTFPSAYQWHVDELELIQSISKQIDEKFIGTNLLINSTWFGPQFDNGEYQKFLDLVAAGNTWQRVFVIAAADPVFLNRDQLMEIQRLACADEIMLLGHFDTQWQFNFHSFVLSRYFREYAQQDLVLKTVKHRFINYNRKPRGHRRDLVEKILARGLDQYGVISLGKNDPVYSGKSASQAMLLGEQPEDYAKEGNWGMSMQYGIPHDIHSLGNMDIWQNHFVTVVSETEFLPWDNLFVSEKTWKPILGLRPFLINGQSKVYAWLESHGFDTFEDVWPVALRDANEMQVHDRICDNLQWLIDQDTRQLEQLYQRLLSRLVSNRDRFFHFAREQKHRACHLFESYHREIDLT